MINRTKVLYGNFVLVMFVLLLGGCTNETNEESTNDSNEQKQEQALTADVEMEEQEEDNPVEEDTPEPETNETRTEITAEERSAEASQTTANPEKDALSEYSSEEIEYARVWLQFAPNQEIEELYVRHIPAGEPINPDDETSAGYPEDVVQLSGVRLVDGSVTYSGNGDGTINIYNVPLRWDGKYPAGEDFYIDIIENTKLEYIEPAEGEEVIELMELIQFS